MKNPYENRYYCVMVRISTVGWMKMNHMPIMPYTVSLDSGTCGHYGATWKRGAGINFPLAAIFGILAKLSVHSEIVKSTVFCG